jgi:hypothetical protein
MNALAILFIAWPTFWPLGSVSPPEYVGLVIIATTAVFLLVDSLIGAWIASTAVFMLS